MTAVLQIFAEWLLQVAMAIGGLAFVALSLFVVIDLLGLVVRGAARRGKAWSRMLFYFANRRRIDGWVQEFRDWEMLRSELKAAMARNAEKSNTIRKLHLNLADMILTAGDRKAACEKLQQQLDVVAVQYTSKCLELQAAVEHCADKGRRIVQLCDEGSQRIVRHEQEKAKLRDLLEEAWGIIANANGADWAMKTDDWSLAATRWRDKWLRDVYPPVPSIEARAEAVQARISAEPAGVTVGAVGGAAVKCGACNDERWLRSYHRVEPCRYCNADGAAPACWKGDDCAGAGKCHGPMKWCAVCGDVSKICDHPAACDAHVETTVGPE